MGSKDGEHVIEAIGRCRITIRDGEVAAVSHPVIQDCPLAKRFGYPIPAITRDNVANNIAHRIRSFGFCTAQRSVVDMRDYVGFGTSEILSTALEAGLLDAVVLACDGAGTVVAPRPSLVQGIGGRMSGLVRTVPLGPVVEMIRQNGGVVVDPVTARLDPEAGVARAVQEGFRRIAVTVAGPGPAEAIREQYPDASIAAVHLTGISRADAERIADVSDLVTACASGPLREIAGKRALIQAGTAIPVFAMTKTGMELVLCKVARSPGPFLVRVSRLPVAGEVCPDPLV